MNSPAKDLIPVTSLFCVMDIIRLGNNIDRTINPYILTIGHLKTIIVCCATLYFVLASDSHRLRRLQCRLYIIILFRLSGRLTRSNELLETQIERKRVF